MFSNIGRISLLLLLVTWAISAASLASDYDRTHVDNQKLLTSITVDGLYSPPTSHTVREIVHALEVLDEEYFETWQGIWPTSIDWTSAVIGTYLAGALSTLSESFKTFPSPKFGENTINKYFSQLVASYFGQNAFSLRQQAYDDMLWVVLGWLEGIKFIEAHSALHYSRSGKTEWYGRQWIPAFAHRARIFWELASQGWDTKLCNGGMIWNPYLTPYKNAITNELYISASVSMYLYFPGDDNDSPFGLSGASPKSSGTGERAHPHDPKYLSAAIEAYEWLQNSNMTDAKGLYVDGYHITGWRRDRTQDPPNTKCDERNEMVYTYNQGVLLTGQRGLYEATGSRSYLEDGHQLISDVVAATGWDLDRGKIVDKDSEHFELGRWHGLGRSGILEEACDAGGYCSQDAQTFKGIFFHHLTTFCQRLPVESKLTERLPDPGLQRWHWKLCQRYQSWIKHNAHAAITTKDIKGRFGMWWGAPENTTHLPDLVEVVLPENAIDYRNEGVPDGWVKISRLRHSQKAERIQPEERYESRDLNDRGRGRTVETQGGGISLVRSLWELVDSRS